MLTATVAAALLASGYLVLTRTASQPRPEPVAPAAAPTPFPASPPVTLSTPQPPITTAWQPAPSTPQPPVTTASAATQLAALDALAQRDPRSALDRAERLNARSPSADLWDRIARCRRAAAAERTNAGSRVLKGAALAGRPQAFQEALREFEAALALDPSNLEAQSGRDAATLALREGGPRAANAATAALMASVSLVQGQTTFSAPEATPPGLGPMPAGVVAHPAQAPMPRAQLFVEALPSRVQVGEAFTIRYSMFNISVAPLGITSVSVRNSVTGSGVTGGGVEPLTRSAPPKTRTLLLETTTTWNYDPSTDWTSTLTVVLEDGSVYRNSPRARP